MIRYEVSSNHIMDVLIGELGLAILLISSSMPMSLAALISQSHATCKGQTSDRPLGVEGIGLYARQRRSA
jgi:hypothetical protein